MDTKKNTYYIDHRDERELARLIVQDRLYNELMEVLPPQFQPDEGKSVVDLGCGPGGWSLQVAQHCPEVSVLGIDVSELMIRYARAQAEARGFPVQFRIMNVLEPWDDLPDHAFDLINMRFIASFVPVTALEPLLQQCWRALRPGGVIRVTDFVYLSAPTAAVTQQLIRLVYETYYRAGFSFSPMDLSLLPPVRLIFHRLGFTEITVSPYVVDVSSGTPYHDPLLEPLGMSLELLQPSWQKMGIGINEAEMRQLAHDFLQEWSESDFSALWHFGSICAVKAR